VRTLAILLVLLVIALVVTIVVAARYARRYYSESLARGQAEERLETWVQAELSGIASRPESEEAEKKD
jgi:hypothetical protein